MQKIDFSLILTATINPGDMPDLVRKDVEVRLNDYKKSFEFWIKKTNIKKIIFIENSNYDLIFFHNLANEYQNKGKEVEILSNNLNSKFDKNLGKGYGQQLLKHALSTAKSLGIKEIFLFTNRILKNSIYIYKKFGFKEVENVDSPYKRGNIKMLAKL